MTADRQHILTIPSVAFKGPDDTDASMFRRAAHNLDNGYDVGGGNLKATVAALLRAAADALETQPTGCYQRSGCGECSELIYRNGGTTPWMHIVTNSPRCYRDPHTDIAYPDPAFAIEIVAPTNIVDAEVVEDDDYPVRQVQL